MKGDAITTVDHLSGMPDDILSSILSSFSMRDAVKMRILSSRWRYFYAPTLDLNFDTLTVLGIDLREMYGVKKFEFLLEHKLKFLKGVDQFLKLYRGPKLNSLRVSFFLGDESASYIDRWISAAFTMNTEKLDLHFSYSAGTFFLDRGTCDKFYDFPCQLLPLDSTSQLKHLCLKSCKFRPSPDLTDRLSSLKTLDLFHAPLDQRDVQSILSGCSNLEWLRLKKSILPVTLCIHGLPRLKVFIMHDCDGVEKIELSSLGLTTLEYIGRVRSFSFVDLPRLEKVHIRFIHGFRRARDYIFYRLANDLPQLQSLSLIFQTEDYLPVPASMPMFNCLKQLELFVFVSSDFKLISLSSLLNASPRLQKLQLMLYRGRERFPREEVEYPKHMHFELKEVEICGFRGRTNELELALYLLDNAISLQRMILTPRRRLYHGSGKWTGNPNIPSRWEGKILKKAYDLLKERANPRYLDMGSILKPDTLILEWIRS